MYLSFKGQTTAAIANNANAAAVETALELLSSVAGVSVAFLDSATQLCSGTGAGVDTAITFTHHPGRQPALVPGSALSSDGGTPAVSVLTGAPLARSGVRGARLTRARRRR